MPETARSNHAFIVILRYRVPDNLVRNLYDRMQEIMVRFRLANGVSCRILQPLFASGATVDCEVHLEFTSLEAAGRLMDELDGLSPGEGNGPASPGAEGGEHILSTLKRPLAEVELADAGALPIYRTFRLR